MVIKPAFVETSTVDPPRRAAIATAGAVFDQAVQTAQGVPRSELAVSVAGLNPVVLYEIAQSDKARRDREARSRGGEMLKALRDVQRACLDGADAEATRRRLATLLASIPEADDPRLKALMQAIAVRAAVEVFRRPALP